MQFFFEPLYAIGELWFSSVLSVLIYFLSTECWTYGSVHYETLTSIEVVVRFLAVVAYAEMSEQGSHLRSEQKLDTPIDFGPSSHPVNRRARWFKVHAHTCSYLEMVKVIALYDWRKNNPENMRNSCNNSITFIALVLKLFLAKRPDLTWS